jgi:hypothetical protein
MAHAWRREKVVWVEYTAGRLDRKKGKRKAKRPGSGTKDGIAEINKRTGLLYSLEAHGASPAKVCPFTGLGAWYRATERELAHVGPPHLGT